MTDERHDFAQARVRLEEIVSQVRKKDTSLERSLDLLEEGVRLANICTELSDHTEWRTVIEEQATAGDSEGPGQGPGEVAGDGAAETASGEEEPTDGAEFATGTDEPETADEQPEEVAEEPLGDDDEASSAE